MFFFSNICGYLAENWDRPNIKVLNLDDPAACRMIAIVDFMCLSATTGLPTKDVTSATT